MDFYEIKDKTVLLEKLASDYTGLEKVLAPLGKDAVDFIPNLEDAWSIREYVAHLLDNEFNGFIRYRKSIAEPGVTLHLGSPNPAARELLCYHEQPVGESLELMKRIRNFMHAHLVRIQDRDWNDFKMDHPAMGMINLNMVLSIYVQHTGKHLVYIRRNISLFEKTEKEKPMQGENK